jgi:malonyl-CoA O-methyltransferase
MDTQKAYNEWSGIYDSNTNLTRDLDQHITRELLAHLQVDSILEIGCGTGKNTAFLAQIARRVRALDFSPGMIEKAKEKVLAKNVTFAMADITQPWPCDAEEFDLIVCNLVLEHIEDLSHIFAQAARTLSTGGRFLINELHPFKQYKGTKARFERGTEIIEVDVFTHHISDFTNAAAAHGLKLAKLNEYWHAEDENKPPRIVSFIFEK